MHSRSPLTSTSLALAISMLAACGTAAPPKTNEPPPPPAPGASAAPIPSAPPEEPPDAPITASLPVLTAEKFGTARAPMGVYSVEGALAVSEGQRVGRIVGDRIEWKASVPKGSPALGDNVVVWVEGRWPDRLDVIMTTSNQRALEPTYMALTGKGTAHTVGRGGSGGFLAGIATVGASTLVLAYSSVDGESTLVSVRGPALVRKHLSRKEAGCSDEEGWGKAGFANLPGVLPAKFGGTSGGTLVAIGDRCEERNAAAEIWEPSGKSRLVDLDQFWTSARAYNDLARVLKGKNDDLWLFINGWNPVLHFHEGRFDAVPMPATRLSNVFLSASGQLHASDGQVIFRLEGDAWVPIAQLAKPTRFENLVMDGSVLWGQSEGSIYKLREGAAAQAPVSCAEPFVYLGEKSFGPAQSPLEPKLSAIRKALSAFPGSAKISVREFEDSYAERVGVAVPNKAVGGAVVAHMKASVKDLQPRLTCFTPKPPPRPPFQGGN